jgi:hypothetical protein
MPPNSPLTLQPVTMALDDPMTVTFPPERRRRTGAAEAGHRTAGTTVRHVLATTFTTAGGFLPLILFGGRFWPPRLG